MTGNYRDQIKRIVRSYNKLPHDIVNRVDTRAIDNIYHFFMDCYNLKDWLINDPVPGIKKGDVETYINNSQHLKIVADFANATKHLMLTKSIRNDKNVDFGLLEISNNQKLLIVFYGSRDDLPSITVSTLATNALKEWRTYLLNNNLDNFSFEGMESLR